MFSLQSLRIIVYACFNVCHVCKRSNSSKHVIYSSSSLHLSGTVHRLFIGESEELAIVSTLLLVSFTGRATTGGSTSGSSRYLEENENIFPSWRHQELKILMGQSVCRVTVRVTVRVGVHSPGVKL